MNQEENLRYWEQRAREASGQSVSWWDINMKAIELDTLAPLLPAGAEVLEVGCSNGAATAELAARSGARITGIDYSPAAIAQAQALQRDGLRFEQADILHYQPARSYDVVFTIRCLINLLADGAQRTALENIHATLKPGGQYLMCEAFDGGLARLNEARAFFGLPPMPMPAQNRYFKDAELDDLLAGLFRVERVIRHASLYYLGTRVFQYLAMDEPPREFDTPLHRFFRGHGRETQHSGDFSPQRLYLLRRL